MNDYEKFMKWAAEEGIDVHYPDVGIDIMRPMASACYSAWRTKGQDVNTKPDMKVVGWYLPEDPSNITASPDICAMWHREGEKVVAVYAEE